MRDKKGFSLIEMLLVMGLITILAVGSISLWRNNNNRIIFNQAKEDVLLALEKARSRAETGFQADLNSKCQGVNYDAANGKLVISEKCGDNCETDCGESTDVYMPASVGNLPVAFRRITAETTAKNITVSLNGKTAVISIKKDGTIIEN